MLPTTRFSLARLFVLGLLLLGALFVATQLAPLIAGDLAAREFNRQQAALEASR